MTGSAREPGPNFPLRATQAWVPARARSARLAGTTAEFVMPNLHRGALDAQSPSRAAAAEQEAFEREVEALRAANARVRIELAEVSTNSPGAVSCANTAPTSRAFPPAIRMAGSGRTEAGASSAG